MSQCYLNLVVPIDPLLDANRVDKKNQSLPCFLSEYSYKTTLINNDSFLV